MEIALTPWLGLDDFELSPSSSLVVLSNLPTHAKAQGHHIVLLTVAWQTALNIVQKSRFESGVLQNTLRTSDIPCLIK